MNEDRTIRKFVTINARALLFVETAFRKINPYRENLEKSKKISFHGSKVKIYFKESGLIENVRTLVNFDFFEKTLQEIIFTLIFLSAGSTKFSLILLS